MACACGKKLAVRKTYIVTFTDGTSKSYSSEVEARAAAERRGGSWRAVG